MPKGCGGDTVGRRLARGGNAKRKGRATPNTGVEEVYTCTRTHMYRPIVDSLFFKFRFKNIYQKEE